MIYNVKTERMRDLAGVLSLLLILGILLVGLNIGLPKNIVAQLQIAVTIAVGVIFIFNFKVRLNKFSMIQLIMWFLLFCWCWSSSFWSPSPSLTAQRTVMIFAPILLVFLLSMSVVETYKTFYTLSKIIVLISAILSLFGILILVFGSVIGSSNIGKVQSLSLGFITLKQNIMGFAPFYRISSFMENPNSFALLVGVAIPLNIMLLYNDKKHKFSGLFILIVQIIALILTYSRNGIALAFITTTVYIFLIHKSYLKRLLIFAGLSLAALVSYLSLSPEMSVLAQGQSASRFSASLNERDHVWDVIFQSIQSRPIAGLGFGISQEELLEPLSINLTAHNVNLTILSEIGIIGYSIVLLLWFSAPIYAIFGLRYIPDESKRALVIVAISITLGLFVHQMFETNLLRFGYINIFWAYLLAFMCRSVE